MIKEQINRDNLISKLIDNTAYNLVAFLFYFKLDKNLDKYEGKFIGSGYILCSIPVIN